MIILAVIGRPVHKTAGKLEHATKIQIAKAEYLLLRPHNHVLTSQHAFLFIIPVGQIANLTELKQGPQHQDIHQIVKMVFLRKSLDRALLHVVPILGLVRRGANVHFPGYKPVVVLKLLIVQMHKQPRQYPIGIANRRTDR